MNQTYVNHELYEWEGFYAYSSIVVRSLNLKVGIISSHPWGVAVISLPIFTSESEGYKVPSTYTTIFFWVLYKSENCLYWVFLKTENKKPSVPVVLKTLNDH